MEEVPSGVLDMIRKMSARRVSGITTTDAGGPGVQVISTEISFVRGLGENEAH